MQRTTRILHSSLVQLLTHRAGFVAATGLIPLPPGKNYRFAFLNRTDAKNIQELMNVAKHAEKTEKSKIPRGAQVADTRRGLLVVNDTGRPCVNTCQDTACHGTMFPLSGHRRVCIRATQFPGSRETASGSSMIRG